MFSKYVKLFAFILIMEIVRGIQSKECYSCEGINCLRISRANNKATCSDPVDNCVTVFEEFTIVARGCYSSLPEKHRIKCDGMSTSHCHKCYKSMCNDKGVISCLQCNSMDHADCSSEVSKMEPSRCPVATSAISYCFTRKFSDKVERGCLIDTNEQLKCLEDSSCEMCIADGEDTCNREIVDRKQSGSNRVPVNSFPLLAVWLFFILLQIY